MRFPLTVRIWGASAVAGRSKLYIPHPGAPIGKAVMFAAGWVLCGLALTRRPVLNLLLLLLISPLGTWADTPKLVPKSKSTPSVGKKLQRKRRECWVLKLGC